MPTSKSSTSSELKPLALTEDRSTEQLEADGDIDYKTMLDELLAVIHRDGGQYTILAGYEVSVHDAKYHISENHRKIRALSDRIKELAK
jgi:hypothetical protein